MVFQFILTACLFASAAFAFWKGEQAERLGAAGLIIAWVATAVFRIQTQWDNHLLIAGVDLAFLLFLGALALRTGRSWPVWAAGFQFMNLLASVVILLGVTRLGLPFYAAIHIATYGLIISLAVGTFWVWQEREALKPLE